MSSVCKSAVSEKAVILFLQDHPSGFGRDVVRELERLGHRTIKVNICLGDWLFWRRGGAVNYRGRLADWPRWLEALILREGVGDIVCFADRHPYHRAAIEVAQRLGIRTSTYEFGYLRPDWITLERGGMSGLSHFPEDPAEIRRIAAASPPPDLTLRYPYTFPQEAFHEVAFNLASYLGRIVYPFYDGEWYYNVVLNYLSYIPRLFAQRRRGQRARARSKRWVASGMRYFLVPLQMQSDYQLRAHSPYRDQRRFIGEVMRSFLAHATSDQHLVFKVHPLDNGFEAWPRVVGRMAQELGLIGRVHAIDGGDLATLVRGAEGVVVVNSTVGVHALRAGCPVKVLGIALFDVAGLTHQGPLDTFWGKPARPDGVLLDDFIRAVAGTIQIKGNFFTRAGRRAAAAVMAERLASGNVNGPLAFVDPPPRLARARVLGIAYSDAAHAAAQAPAAGPAAAARPELGEAAAAYAFAGGATMPGDPAP